MNIYDIDNLPLANVNTVNIKDITTDIIEYQGFKEFKAVNVDWTINNECQLNCKYCCAKKDMFVTKTNSNYEKVIKKLQLILVPFTICLLGGEPTLHPDIFKIIEELTKLKYCKGVNLITNLHKPLEFWKELAGYNFNKFSIDASLHPEYYNDKFLEKVNYLKSTETEINVLLNVFPEKKYYDKMNHAINNIDDLTIVNIFETEDYKPKITDEFLEMFFEKDVMFNYHINNVNNSYKYTELQKYNLVNFKGWKCTAQDLIITQEGDIKNACTNKKVIMYTHKHRDEMIICPLDSCPCDTFMHFYKYKG